MTTLTTGLRASVLASNNNALDPKSVPLASLDMLGFGEESSLLPQLLECLVVEACVYILDALSIVIQNSLRTWKC